MAVLTVIVCSLMAACSSDDDEDENGGKGMSTGKRLTQIEMRDSWGSSTTSFVYGADGELSDISVSSDGSRYSYTDNIIFTIGMSNISWIYKDGYNNESYRFKVTLQNDRAQKGRIKIDEDCYFTYDGKNRLQELDTEIDFDGTVYTETYILKWDGGNIKTAECYYDGILNEKVEYTYSKYKAGMLAYEIGINPLTEFDFLDCVYERAIFYTGYCGPLSEYLPSSAVFYDKNGAKIGERSYKYATSGGNVTSVTIDGYYNGNLSYGYPWKMNVMWE